MAVSSSFQSVTNSSVMPASATKNVSRISPGRSPPVCDRTRGCVNVSAIRTATKLSGTKAPAAIANTEE